MVFHDDTLDRLCNTSGKISDFTYSQLQNFNLKGTDERIPLFSDVLNVLAGKPVICELKTQGSILNTSICSMAVDIIEAYKGFICVESFNPFIMKWFKENKPEFIRGQLANKPAKGKFTINGFFLWQYMVNCLSRPDFLAFNYRQSSLGLSVASKLFKAQTVAYSPRGASEIDKAKTRFDRVIFEALPSENLLEY